MITKSTRCVLAAVALSVLVAPTALYAAQTFAGVSLKVSCESASPAGIAQVKVAVTEPKPISTGGTWIGFGGLDTFEGIALMSPANDTFGVAEILGSQIRFDIRSTTSSFGTSLDYPILTVAARVPATAPIGTVMPVTIDAISLIDPGGAVYPTEIRDGSVTVGPGVSIDDVSPGSADLPAGSVVTITGRGFEPRTKVRFNETTLAAVQILDATHIQVVLASAARMHGKRISIGNPDGSRTTYFSYQRTRRQGTSAFPALQNAVPLFPLRLVTEARVDIPAVSTALALQNIGDVAAPVTIDLLAPDGQVLATTGATLNASRFTVTEISELFGIGYLPSFSVRVRSAVPIQVMGIEVDPSGNATPIAPR